MENIYIKSNANSLESQALAEDIFDYLIKRGYKASYEYSKETDFAISVGGDGTFLRTVKEINFSKIPILGVNTGHVGFFTELTPGDIKKIPLIIKNKKYILQKCKTISTKVYTKKGTETLSPALNDVLVGHVNANRLIHLNLSIGDSFIEQLSGDGMLISSSTGSTAYNYSLGGSIIDPKLKVLQITPLAPANNSVYRSFMSSILAPADDIITIEPEDHGDATITIDGEGHLIHDIKKIEIALSKKEINIVRLPNYNFWENVKSKFL